MWNQLRIAFMLVLAAAGQGVVIAQMNTPKKTRPQHSTEIVFVCEHGAALSVVSAAYFNKMAHEQQLPFHAIARGTDPQPELAVSARQGLNADGVPFETKQPQKLSMEDAMRARRVIAFVPLEPKYSSLTRVESWKDVPATAENYARARDAIVAHIRELIRSLRSEKQDALRRPL
jgi:protein-tyrosine-phosphatase